MLEESDRKFLLSLVDKTDSDYHDGLDGWDNYYIAHGMLVVSFEDGETNSVMVGKWKLVPIDD